MHFAQLFQFTQCTNLFGKLFTKANYIFIDAINFKALQLFLFLFNQEVYSVKRYAAVVTDNTTTTVSIWKTSNDTGFTSSSHFRCICIKNALVVRLANMRKHFNNTFWYIKTVSLTSIEYHVNTAEWMNRTLERSITLHTYDLFLVFIQISRSMRNDCGRSVCIYIQYSACFSFFYSKNRNDVPQFFSVICCTFQE
ncbi:hypothetical protein D3C81_1498750 [compost metagenome]